MELSAIEAAALMQSIAKVQKHTLEVTLFRQGDEIYDVLLIKNGFVKMTRLEEDGNETVVAWRKSGQSICSFPLGTSDAGIRG